MSNPAADNKEGGSIDPLDEVCPTCKAVPGHPCDLSIAITPKEALMYGGPWHPLRYRKALRRTKRRLGYKT